MAHVRAVLASGPGMPGGSTDQGLEMDVPLTPLGRIDETALIAADKPLPARRFRPDREDWSGVLVATDGGFALQSEFSRDDPIWAMEAQTFRPGDYVTLRRPNGDELAFRIVAVDPE